MQNLGSKLNLKSAILSPIAHSARLCVDCFHNIGTYAGGLKGFAAEMLESSFVPLTESIINKFQTTILAKEKTAVIENLICQFEASSLNLALQSPIDTFHTLPNTEFTIFWVFAGLWNISVATFGWKFLRDGLLNNELKFPKFFRGWVLLFGLLYISIGYFPNFLSWFILIGALLKLNIVVHYFAIEKNRNPPYTASFYVVFIDMVWAICFLFLLLFY